MEYLTVEEAAQRLGVSLATVRRWAKEGKIAAEKSGKQWIIDGSRLRGRRSHRRASAQQPPDVEAAFQHVKGTDLAELPVPDILRWADEAEDSEVVLAGARSCLEGSSLGDALEVDVDKNALSTRRMTVLGLEDRVAYQALIASFADRIEARTPDAVFSARLADNPRYFFKRASDQWARWREAALAQLNSDQEWLATTDLVAYFDTIPHRQLLADLQTLNVDPVAIGLLREMLDRWGLSQGLGIPQGPNASRLLGNLFLLPVDQAMLDEGWKYSRFLDDILITTATRAEAVEAIRQFESECRVRGLIVSSSKTQLLHGDVARKYLLRSARLGGVEYLMNVNANRLARKQLKSILRAALKHEAAVDEREARFSLWRLAKLRDPGVLRQVLDRLEDLAPLASVTAAYLNPFVSRPKTVKGLSSFLADSERSYSPYLVTWLLAVMVEHPSVPESWKEQAMRRLKDRNQPVYLRSVAAVVVGKGRRPGDISWIKREVEREHDPRMLRAYVVALRWAGQLDRGTRKEISRRSPRMSRTIAYLDGRSHLPSLIYAEKSIPLPTD